MASPVRIIPTLPPRPQSTENHLAEMDTKIDWLVDQLTELLATTHRIAERLDGSGL